MVVDICMHLQRLLWMIIFITELCCTGEGSSRMLGQPGDTCHIHTQAYGEDDYLLFDCPGQIELYSHISVFRSFVDYLKSDGWSLAAVYTVDCQFVGDPTKFIAGSLQAMSAMVQLELPHVNVLTKVDLLGDENKVRNFSLPAMYCIPNA